MTDTRPLHERFIDLIDTVHAAANPDMTESDEDVATMAASFVEALGDERAIALVAGYLASLDQSRAVASSRVVDMIGHDRFPPPVA